MIPFEDKDSWSNFVQRRRLIKEQKNEEDFGKASTDEMFRTDIIGGGRGVMTNEEEERQQQQRQISQYRHLKHRTKKEKKREKKLKQLKKDPGIQVDTMVGVYSYQCNKIQILFFTYA